METALAPVGQDIVPAPSLGYTGIDKFTELRKQSQTRIETTTQIGMALAQNSFRIYDDVEVRKMIRKITRGNVSLRIKERQNRFFDYMSDDLPVSIFAFTIGFAVLGAIIAPILAKLLLLITSGWSADLPVLIAVGVGAATPIIFGIGSFIGSCVWNFSVFGGAGFNWHRIPIAEYLPPLISVDQLQRLEQLHTDLSHAGVTSAFFVRHGTADEAVTLTKAEGSVTTQGEQLRKWQKEAGFIELEVTFPDGETNTLTIARTVSFL